MPAGETLRVEGLADLQRAFKLADRDLRLGLKRTLRQIGEPVRADAERLADEKISHIGIPWSRMRTGVTLNSVYVAPRQRGLRNGGLRSRPNLAGLLMDKAMLPALQRNEGRTLASVNQMLNGLASDWERA